MLIRSRTQIVLDTDRMIQASGALEGLCSTSWCSAGLQPMAFKLMPRTARRGWFRRHSCALWRPLDSTGSKDITCHSFFLDCGNLKEVRAAPRRNADSSKYRLLLAGSHQQIPTMIRPDSILLLVSFVAFCAVIVPMIIGAAPRSHRLAPRQSREDCTTDLVPDLHGLGVRLGVSRVL